MFFMHKKNEKESKRKREMIGTCGLAWRGVRRNSLICTAILFFFWEMTIIMKWNTRAHSTIIYPYESKNR